MMKKTKTKENLQQSEKRFIDLAAGNLARMEIVKLSGTVLRTRRNFHGC